MFNFHSLFKSSLCLFFILTISCNVEHPILDHGSSEIVEELTVPFEDRYGAIIFEAEANGSTNEFVFDSGAGVSLLEESFVKELGLETFFLTTGFDANKTEGDFFATVLNSFSIGNQTYMNYRPLVVPIEDQNWKCLGAQGIFGAFMMKNSVWKIDIKNRLLTSYKNSIDESRLNGYTKVPFTTDEYGIPKIKITINGKELLYTVDLGSTHGLDISTEEYIKISQSSDKELVKGRGYNFAIFGNKLSDYSMYQIQSAVIGNITINNPVVRVKDKVSLKIGMDFFKNYESIFDWKREILYLKNTSDEKYSSEFSQIGFNFIDDKFIVSNVADYSEDMQVSLDDEVLEINDQKIDQNTICDVLQSLYINKEMEVKIKYKNKDNEIKETNITPYILL